MENRYIILSRHISCGNGLKWCLSLVIFLLISNHVFPQMGIGTTSPHGSSMLEIKTVSHGFLPPRMTFAQRNDIPNPSEGLMVFCTDCGTDGAAVLCIFQSGKWQNYLWDCPKPESPGEAVHSAGTDQITWNWNDVPIAVGYKWNTENDSTTATDMGAATSKTETGLLCNSLYHRFIWAYNECGTSAACTLSFSTVTSPCFACGSSLSVTHTAGDVAPVDKTVSYGTVTNLPGGSSVCWITQNLGSSQQATAVNDATENSAGWYWQFNRKQGYKHDGTTRTPGTSWITPINEDFDWQQANDPCVLELGDRWRMPTISEWYSVASGWTNWNSAWNSPLKMHAAGYLNQNNGNLTDRGANGAYWSLSQYLSAEGWYLHFNNTISRLYYYPKASGFTVRCLTPVNPTVTTTAASNISQTKATSGGNVTSSGGETVQMRGICWSINNNPSTINDHTTDGSGTGTYNSLMTGLTPGTTYYVRAYATNSLGTSYGSEVSFTTSPAFTCGTSLVVYHVAGSVSAEGKVVTYPTVTNIPGETSLCWITRNLGASQQATAVNDATEASAGWYWQFNAKQGFKHDGSTRTPNTPWISSINQEESWNPQNDPCLLELGAGWRLPSASEWNNVKNGGGWVNWNGPWNSLLKIHAAGYLNPANGNLTERGTSGAYWSSSQYMANEGWYFFSYTSGCLVRNYAKASGFPIRCVK